MLASTSLDCGGTNTDYAFDRRGSGIGTGGRGRSTASIRILRDRSPDNLFIGGMLQGFDIVLRKSADAGHTGSSPAAD
jgi:hypothetical protein